MQMSGTKQKPSQHGEQLALEYHKRAKKHTRKVVPAEEDHVSENPYQRLLQRRQYHL